MFAARLRFLRMKLNEGKPITIRDVNLVSDAADYIVKLENDVCALEGELDLHSEALKKWELSLYSIAP